MNRIDNSFYKKSAAASAPELLGKLLVRKLETGEILRYRITETECYYGESDTACHAHKGKTPRTEVLYQEGGAAYVYLCYGIHSLLNVVTGEKGFPQAVLIRGIEGVSGPGRVTKALQIDRSLNKEDLRISEKLWIEDDGYKAKYKTKPRVGINYAAPKDIAIEWRFIAVQDSDI